MNQIIIVSAWEAKNIVLKYPHKLNVISAETTEIVDSNRCRHHLHLKMDDIDDTAIQLSDKLLKEKGVVYPEKQHVLDAVEFDKKYPVDMIHCHAGISRSTSIGYAILRSRGMTKEEALNTILYIQPYAMPNKRIVRFADEIFSN